MRASKIFFRFLLGCIALLLVGLNFVQLAGWGPDQSTILLQSEVKAKRLRPSTSLPAIIPPPSGAEGWVVVIDPGHGGLDSGSVFDNISEKALNLELSKRLAEKLRKRGVPVVLTRSEDRHVGLEERAAMADAQGRALFVSIHQNSSQVGVPVGIETFFTKSRPGSVLSQQRLVYGLPRGGSHSDHRSEILARRVQRALVERTGAHDRGVKNSQFVVTRRPVGPAILVECGFLNNPKERQLLKSAKYQEKLAEGMADGVLEYFEESGGDPLFGLQEKISDSPKVVTTN